MSFSALQFYHDCGLVFFCSALVVGLALDFFAQNRKQFRSLGKVGLAYACFPCLIVAVAILIYSVCFRGNPDMNIIINLQLVLFTMSIAYAFAEKRRIFRSR